MRADSRRTVRQRWRVPADTDGRRVLRIFQFHVRLSSALADREGDLGERGDHGQRDRESYGLRGSVADREHHTADGVCGVLQHQHHDLHRALRRIHEIQELSGTGCGMSGSKRIEWIDVAKGVGIVLVSFGHLRNGDGESVWLPALDVPIDAIYLFHMPLFFLLGGAHVQ